MVLHYIALPPNNAVIWFRWMLHQNKFSHPEDEGDTFLGNTETNTLYYTVQTPRKTIIRETIYSFFNVCSVIP